MEISITSIDGLVRLSPNLLHTIQEITMMSDTSTAASLKSRLIELTQELPEKQLTAEARDVINSTAETYRLGALLLLECKCPR